MSDENNVIIIPENIKSLYAESIKGNANESISDLDNIVTDKGKVLHFLNWCKNNIISEKILASEFLNFINSFWLAIKERVTFTEINRILECLYSAANQNDQKYDDSPNSNAIIDILDKYEIADKVEITEAKKKRETKFEDYFNLIDSIYDKYCSRVIAIGHTPTGGNNIKLGYQVLYWAGLHANSKGFCLESLLNFIDKNLAACNEVNTKLAVLDKDDIYYISKVLWKGMIGFEKNVLGGDEVARIFNVVNRFYKILCTEIENKISRLGFKDYDSGYGEVYTDIVDSLVRSLDVAIKKGNVEKIQTEAVFVLASNAWEMFCRGRTNRKSQDSMFGILNVIIHLLEKKNESIDKANKKLKQIGCCYIIDVDANETGWNADEKSVGTFLSRKKDYYNLISEIYEIYFGKELGEGIDNTVPAPSVAISNHSKDNAIINNDVDINNDNENNNLNGYLNYYGDINNNKMDTEVDPNNNDINKDKENNNDINRNLNNCGDINVNSKSRVNQNNGQTVKLHEEEFERISLIPDKNSGELNSNNKNKASDNNSHHDKKKQSDIYGNDESTEIKNNIIDKHIDPKIILVNNISNNKDLDKDRTENNQKILKQTLRANVQEVNLDDQFKYTAIYCPNLFSIVFKLISFVSLTVNLLLLISLLPQFAPVFAPILKSLAAKLILLVVTLSVTLVTWKLSITLKSKIPCDNNDKNKKIGEEQLEQLNQYIINKSDTINESKRIIRISDDSQRNNDRY